MRKPGSRQLLAALLAVAALLAADTHQRDRGGGIGSENPRPWQRSPGACGRQAAGVFSWALRSYAHSSTASPGTRSKSRMLAVARVSP